jgi:glycosyl transferase, family 25
MNSFDYFDEIYCINLDKRTRRWELAQNEFKKLGILDKVKRFSAIDNLGGKRGCFESHMKIIHMAKENNLKNVFIFEDDVAVLPCYSHEKFEKSINFLKDQTWEFFYMGGLERRIKPRPMYNKLKKKYDTNDVSTEFDYIMEAHSVGWNQSYAINSCIFDKIIAEYKNGLWEMLEERWKCRPGRTDRYYQHHLKPKAYVCVPSFTTQYDVVSDLQRTRTNRSLRLNPEDNI